MGGVNQADSLVRVTGAHAPDAVGLGHWHTQPHTRATRTCARLYMELFKAKNNDRQTNS